MGRRTLIVGDIHGCAQELEDLLERAHPTHVVVVGDLFTKGPDPLGVWRALEQVGAPAGVLGNHDDWVLRRRDEGPWRSLPGAAWAWLEALPIFREEAGLMVVHAGIHPTEGRPGTTRRMALHMRRWPDDRGGESSAHPFWWEVYAGPGLIVYGHDARRGLVDRRPATLGLDTGCVYGGQLTGYLVEADRLIQVPARRTWHPVAPPRP